MSARQGKIIAIVENGGHMPEGADKTIVLERAQLTAEYAGMILAWANAYGHSLVFVGRRVEGAFCNEARAFCREFNLGWIRCLTLPFWQDEGARLAVAGLRRTVAQYHFPYTTTS